MILILLMGTFLAAGIFIFVKSVAQIIDTRKLKKHGFRTTATIVGVGKPEANEEKECRAMATFTDADGLKQQREFASKSNYLRSLLEAGATVEEPIVVTRDGEIALAKERITPVWFSVMVGGGGLVMALLFIGIILFLFMGHDHY